MPKWSVSRDVEEWIEVEAEDEGAAQVTANETPIEEWTREVKEERVLSEDTYPAGTDLSEYLADEGSSIKEFTADA